MKKLDTAIEGLILISLDKYTDNRGYFIESFNEEKFKLLGINEKFKQDNHSRSNTGVIRGMHFQSFPGQGKLVRCARGKIWDVAVDIRPNSPTFKRWQGFELSEENNLALYIPVGFAHGFQVLEGPADVHYKCTELYNQATEKGFLFNDPEIDIKWPLLEQTVSERDLQAPLLKDLTKLDY